VEVAFHNEQNSRSIQSLNQEEEVCVCILYHNIGPFGCEYLEWTLYGFLNQVIHILPEYCCV